MVPPTPPCLPPPSDPGILIPPPSPPFPDVPAFPPAPTHAIKLDPRYKNNDELLEIPIKVYSISFTAVNLIVDNPPLPPLYPPLFAPLEAYISIFRMLFFSVEWN